MYGVIEYGGKQYRVEKGSKIKIDRVVNKNVSDEIIFDKVIVVIDGEEVKTDSGKKVYGKVLRHLRSKKVIVFKKRPKKGYKKMIGHRQNLTEVEITDIQVKG